MGILSMLNTAAQAYAPALYEGADKIKQMRMRTQMQDLTNRETLAASGTPVSDSSIGPSIPQTSQITPDLPSQVASSMQAPRTLDLPDFKGGPSSTGPSYTPQQDLPTQLAGTGAQTTAAAPVDTVHPSRMFHYGGQDYVLHTPEELRAIGRGAAAASKVSEMTAAGQGASDVRSRFGVPTEVPGMVPGTTETVPLLPEERSKMLERSLPVVYRNEGTGYTADRRLEGVGYTADQRLAGVDLTSGRRLQGTEETNATRADIAAGRDETTRYAIDSRTSLGLSGLQIRAAQVAARNAEKTGDPDALRKAATVVSRLQQHRAKIAAALQSGVMLDSAGFQVPLKPEGKVNLQAELDATDKNIAGFQQTATGPASNTPAAAAPSLGTPAKQLTDPAMAKQYLQKANGDATKARALAKADGWRF